MTEVFTRWVLGAVVPYGKGEGKEECGGGRRFVVVHYKRRRTGVRLKSGLRKNKVGGRIQRGLGLYLERGM